MNFTSSSRTYCITSDTEYFIKIHLPSFEGPYCVKCSRALILMYIKKIKSAGAVVKQKTLPKPLN